MKGYILLEGGAEFTGRMAEADLRALELAGGLDSRLVIIPAAAAAESNHEGAGNNGLRWFRLLGARSVSVLPLIDRDSADESALAASLRDSPFIYILGGSPTYLHETLCDSTSWQAIADAYTRGAVIGGSSAGAMVLCGRYYDPVRQRMASGLNLVPGICLIPHHDTFGKEWAARLAKALPEDVIVGIDEETGMIDDAPEGQWNVYGKGVVTLYEGGKTKIYHPGTMFSF